MIPATLLLTAGITLERAGSVGHDASDPGRVTVTVFGTKVDGIGQSFVRTFVTWSRTVDTAPGRLGLVTVTGASVMVRADRVIVIGASVTVRADWVIVTGALVTVRADCVIVVGATVIVRADFVMVTGASVIVKAGFVMVPAL